jgi:hypothetical protein
MRFNTYSVVGHEAFIFSNILIRNAEAISVILHSSYETVLYYTPKKQSYRDFPSFKIRVKQNSTKRVEQRVKKKKGENKQSKQE